MIKMYGIPNCDTVKKAKKQLEISGVEFEFIDFKKEVPTTDFLEKCRRYSGDWPVNPRGRVYKQFSSQFIESNDKEKLSLMKENTSMIKRPILEVAGETFCIGFDLDKYKTLAS